MKKIMEVELDQKVVDKEVKRILGDEKASKSGKMKELFGLGLDIKEIAVLMNVRYNFVYNVIQNLVIVEGVQIESNKQSSKKDAVWKMLDEGKTTKEIAVDLRTNYNYIYKLKKEWEAEVVAEAEKMLEAK